MEFGSFFWNIRCHIFLGGYELCSRSYCFFGALEKLILYWFDSLVVPHMIFIVWRLSINFRIFSFNDWVLGSSGNDYLFSTCVPTLYVILTVFTLLRILALLDRLMWIYGHAVIGVGFLTASVFLFLLGDNLLLNLFLVVQDSLFRGDIIGLINFGIGPGFAFDFVVFFLLGCILLKGINKLIPRRLFFLFLVQQI